MDNIENTLARHLDRELDFEFAVKVGSNDPIFTNVLDLFVEECKSIMSENDNIIIDLPKIFGDKSMYNWYYGNFLNKIILLIYQPYLYTNSNTYVSKSQAQDALRCCFKLITEYNCNVHEEDYYEWSILSYLYNVPCMKKGIPEYLINFLPSFRFLFRNGTDCISIQKKFVRSWHEKYKTKRRSAVSVIEKHWLMVMYSPNTDVGMRKIKTLKEHFMGLV